ncbi:MAG: V-type ATPase subunit [Clostridia bacterium]|nr:V-type ATPase subunit [Clostridia bacterium]
MKSATMSVVALVRSLRAKRLSEADFEKLSGAASILSAAAILNNMPAYKDRVGPSANPQSIGEELRSGLYEDIAKISRYSRAAGHDFTDYFIFRTDVEGLSDAIAALHAGTHDFTISFSAGYEKLSRLNLLETAGAHDLAGLMKSAEGTRYKELLTNVLTEYTRTGDIIRVEAGLTHGADIRFLEVSGGRRRGMDIPSASFRKTGLFRLRAAESDLTLIKHFARAARFDVPREARIALSSPVITTLTDSKLAALADLDDPSRLPEILAGTDYSQLDTSDVETAADAALAKILDRTLIYSFDPDELVFAYILSKNTEIRRIVGCLDSKE